VVRRPLRLPAPNQDENYCGVIKRQEAGSVKLPASFYCVILIDCVTLSEAKGVLEWGRCYPVRAVCKNDAVEFAAGARTPATLEIVGVATDRNSLGGTNFSRTEMDACLKELFPTSEMRAVGIYEHIGLHDRFPRPIHERRRGNHSAVIAGSNRAVRNSGRRATAQREGKKNHRKSMVRQAHHDNALLQTGDGA